MIKEDFRTAGITYLDTAHDGLFSRKNALKINKIRSESLEYITKVRAEFGSEGLPRTQALLAEYLNCSKHEVCLVNSFSVGFNYLLPSLEVFNKVLLLDNDYPSLWMPLGLRDFELKMVSPDANNRFTAESIIAHAEEFKPEIIALSHVQYTTGFMSDIKSIGEYCSANNIVFIVDATQSFGCVPIDLSKLKIDVLAASTYKWMCAGHGAGFIYVNKKLQSKIKFKLGWYGVAQKFGDQWESNQSLLNLEAGHKDHEAFYRLQFALEDGLQRSTQEVFNHNSDLILKLKEILVAKEYELISNFKDEEYAGILVIKEPEGLYDRLMKNNIIVTQRGGTIRLSCHFYNQQQDLERLKDCLLPAS